MIKHARLNFRVTEHQKKVISEAAKIKQTTASEFVLQYAYDAACEVLASQVDFRLSEEKWKDFCRALDAPPRDIPELKRLLAEQSVFDA